MREARHNQGIAFSEDVIAIVRRHYRRDGPKRTADIADLTITQVYGIASRLGLTKGGAPQEHRDHSRPSPNKPKAYDTRPLQDALTHFTATLKPMDAEPMELR